MDIEIRNSRFSRDTNPSRSKIWRLSLFQYPSPSPSDKHKSINTNHEGLTRHIIPEKFRRWIFRTVLFSIETTREGLKVFKIGDFMFYPFQNLNLLSGWRTANYILPLMVVIVNFSSAKSSRVSKPQCRRVSKFISMADLVNFFSRKLQDCHPSADPNWVPQPNNPINWLWRILSMSVKFSFKFRVALPIPSQIRILRREGKIFWL